MKVGNSVGRCVRSKISSSVNRPVHDSTKLSVRCLVRHPAKGSILDSVWDSVPSSSDIEEKSAKRLIVPTLDE
jgi:hypothetical protein